MDTFTLQDLQAVAAVRAQWCVSLYMPLHPLRDGEQDRIRLRNLLRDYRNVYGEPPKTGSEELDILSDILKIGPCRYPQLLWQALGAPHMLVQKNGSLPGAYQHIVVNGLDGLQLMA